MARFHPRGVQAARRLALACCCAVAMALPARAAEFLLIHGAFVGPWYWAPVAQGLEARGHGVRAVALSGQGGAEVPAEALTLDHHIADVTRAIDAAAGPVILVAHSYGGRPVTGAWDRRRDKVAAAIYLEAVAPYGTGPLAMPFERNQQAALAQTRPDLVDAGVMPPPDHLRRRYPDHPLYPMPLTVLWAELPWQNGKVEGSGAYVVGARSEARIFREYGNRVARERGWTIYEIETGHDMVHDDADVVIRLLDHLASELTD